MRTSLAFATPTVAFKCESDSARNLSTEGDVLLRANVTLEPASDIMPMNVNGTDKYASGIT